ncbi:hypothetical protein HJ590_04685 [Naumannella sp. ID2617S]|nr:hypothetical protein [Naumannella sp. ID2617S]
MAQWIHVDPERAAQGPFGTTIAHGYLTLSLVPSLVSEVDRLDGLASAGRRTPLESGSQPGRRPLSALPAWCSV